MIKKTIEKLIGTGLTENEIVSLLKEGGINTTQPTINRLKTGFTASTNYELGTAIITLYEKIRRKGKAA